MSEGADNVPPGTVSQPNPTQSTEGAQKAPVTEKGKPVVEEGQTTDATGEKKLTGAQLKAKQKAAKAEKRAQEKAKKEVSKAEAAVSSSPQQLGPAAAEIKSKKGKQDGTAVGPGGRPALAKAPSAIVTEQKAQIPECFSHLSMAKRIPMTQADKDVYPSVLALGQQMATFAIDESIIRLKATLLAFKKVIQTYNTPHGHTLARHFTPHVLNPQIEYLTACRPMCFSMGNAIRWLKLQVSKIDLDASEEDAKRDLCLAIDTFITERITVADEVVTETAARYIRNGDTILTYGRSGIVERTILLAQAAGTKFAVYVIDDPYERLGQQLAKNLSAEGVEVSYCGDFGGLTNYVRRATKLVIGAEAMFSNGALYGRTGTCDVALAANELGKEVIVLCETINITERVATDSLTYNEIDPERCQASALRLLFDTTPEQYLQLLITELGTVQPTSAPDLLRKLEEFN